MSLLQDVDSIIAEENITDATPAVIPDETPEVPEDQTEVTPDIPETPDTPEVPEEQPEVPETPETTIAPEVPEVPSSSASKTVEDAKSFIDSLNLSEDKIFNEDGSVKAWRDVVPAGAYLASQLDPVKVTDKDGKTHEFLLLSDVEKAFPEGFEAKNNLEQMRFQKQIMDNETKFDEAVRSYEDAEKNYIAETTNMVQSQERNNSIATEYRAMADAGLVPKVGDPKDPKFGESEAVKTLNNILDWTEKKNEENRAKGLGEITSLYVAKQLMDIEGSKAAKNDKKQEIIQQRNEVASLSSTPAPEQQHQKKVYDIPMSRLADSIIAEEGLK